MSLKAELEIWTKALAAYDSHDYDEAISLFEQIAETSKIHFNIGVILATKGEHPNAIRYFNEAVALDQYFAVAYFQAGVSLFLMGDFQASLQQSEAALLFMRGNQDINYEQLGFHFKLYACEILFNIGIAKFYLGDRKGAAADFAEASKLKVTPDHNVVDEALQSGGGGLTVFSIPVGILFRPSEQKVKNMKPKDYLGKAKLIAASDPNDAFTTFTGATRLKMGQTAVGQVRMPVSTETPNVRFETVTEIGRSKTTRLPRINTTELVRRAPSASSAPARPAPRLTTPTDGIPALTRSSSRDSQASSQAHTPPDVARLRDNPLRIDDLYEDYYANPEPDILLKAADRGVRMQRQHSYVRLPLRRPSNAAPSRSGTVRTVVEEASLYDESLVMTKIRIKVRVDGDTRGMSATPETQLRDFLSQLAIKLDRPPYDLVARFKDEEGDMVSLRDEGDWEAAVDCARCRAGGSVEGKLEVWVE